ncbi:FAD-dependent oxidoreductase [Flavobacterium rivuli WB 3.3-2 = DSM 21788]|uniref:FAD-dependent oxidoreductase n=1 Tax=Flavobacterium rivuli WB 3.3-2 = DSM 21788 TaxID=1121895 RepID=A0A0A2M3K3_9FLAO|nr:NAD(P)/FAD-dependent oxidoreductase [Flavobacterium rivuli]KGO86864.1 FAD-dependent oxidoreductase [Flavobacterium rivuli WB 3.3-2 = DSM 21788]
MATNHDVLIIGGGLAGLASAIHLSKQGLSVIVIEKSGYPRHKVCGEYISNEILPYLEWLDVDVSTLNPTQLHRLEFSTTTRRAITAQLPLGGFGISRFTLDNFLYLKALANGCMFIEDTVNDVFIQDDMFRVQTKNDMYMSKIVLGAFGKRSNIDQQLARSFIGTKSPWLAVKAHYSGNFPNDLVALHNFSGGYCGVSKVEDNKINICYLADYATFKQYKNIEDYQHEVLYKNKCLETIFENSTIMFDKPLTIGQICFDKKLSVEKHILMMGDSAGLIHPLCGNGMAMAIHSAKIASELVLCYYSGQITREVLEKQYALHWNRLFNKRLFTGRMLGKVLQNKSLTNQLMEAAVNFPVIVSKIVKHTHGKPIKTAAKWE